MRRRRARIRACRRAIGNYRVVGGAHAVACEAAALHADEHTGHERIGGHILCVCGRARAEIDRRLERGHNAARSIEKSQLDS